MRRELKASVAAVALLSGSGFAALAQDSVGGPTQLQEVVVETTPVPNAAGISANKVPSAQSRVVASQFEEQHQPSVTDAITAHVPGAVALNVDGSDLSPDLFYRGFDASRIPGSSIGLAVYENGVRINEGFGDTVNLDLIPPIAVANADVYTNNPVFGLNALGGAINFTMKNGFTYQGGDVTALGGSFGRANLYGEYGKQSGNWSVYGAGDLYYDGGYRPFGAQNAQRFYGDLGYRSQDAEMHLITQYGRSLLGVQGVTPQVLVDQQYNSVFTSPQTTENKAFLGQLTGRYDVSQHWTVNSNFYIRSFYQKHIDGNDGDIEDCGDTGGQAGTLCLPEDDAPFASPQQRQYLVNGNPIAGTNIDGTPYGTTANTQLNALTEGGQLQATNKDTLWGHDNYFVVGGSIDHTFSNFTSFTTIGLLNPAFQNVYSGVNGAGDILQTAGNIGYGSTFVNSTATYYGLYALDTFNVTNRFAVTAGARGNIAVITLADLSGQNPYLNSSNSYNRINPVVGATYEFTKAFTVYGGYSEANRAPTPLESACADPNRPCVLETSLVSDPKLQQPVSHTYEAGARGVFEVPNLGGGMSYKAGFFRTQTDNDIISEPSNIPGFGYYSNVGSTLRQGVEAGVTYVRGPWSFYGNYAFVDATYQFAGQLSSPNNPNAAIQANGGVENVVPGNHIPGIPRNIAKLGFEYQVTPRFTVGMDTVIVGSQYYIGDDTNVNPQLPAYYFLNAHASYQLTDHVQVFVLGRNITNNRYATYGTYYDTGTDAQFVAGSGGATLAANNPDNGGPGNASAITVAQPLSVYGGVKVSF